MGYKELNVTYRLNMPKLRHEACGLEYSRAMWRLCEEENSRFLMPFHLFDQAVFENPNSPTLVNHTYNVVFKQWLHLITGHKIPAKLSALSLAGMCRFWLDHGMKLKYRVLLTGFFFQLLELPRWLRQQRIHLQCRRPGFHPWVRKIPWRWQWLPIPVFLPGKVHRQRSLVDYSPWSHRVGHD